MRRFFWWLGLVMGIVLIAGAGVIRWVVAPAVTVLPSDTNTQRTYTGTAASVINPSITKGTLYGPAILHNQPVTVMHHVKVLKTNGDNALVSEQKKVSILGNTIADQTHRYAVDRKDMGRGSAFPDVVQQTGVTFNWPINTQQRDYTGWNSDTRSTSTLKYSGEAKRGGVDTYVFKASVPPTRITDPVELAQLPAQMPKSLLSQMAPSLGLTIPQLQQMQKVIDSLPDPVPFAYLFSGTSTYWVAPDSGIVVDVASHEVRTSAFDLGNGKIVPVGPVLDFSYTSPPLTLKAAADDATDSANQMKLIETTIPLVALIAGLVLVGVLVTVAAIRRRRQPPAAPPVVAAPPRELTPVG
jgi:hypothetical protein